MKIGLVLAYKGVNYGMLLQAFATQRKIEELGYKTEIIDYSRVGYKCIRFSPYLPFFFASEALKTLRNRKNVPELDEKHKENIIERKKVSNEFIERCLLRRVKINGIDSLKKYTKENYNGVLVGSDQIWPPDAAFGNFTTLRFVPDEVNKISYATSLGVSKYPFWCKSSAADFMRRINHISVREEQGKNIIGNFLNKEVKIVTDPTYLFTREQWLELIPSEPNLEDDYILCYFLGNTKEHKQLARRYADHLNKKLISILSTESYSDIDISYADKIVSGVGPESFVNLVRHAAIVMTDSFHGVAFSVINNKQFYVFYRTVVGSKNSRNSRIDNILKLWGLESRLILNNTSVDDFPRQKINYAEVNERVASKRKYSIEYLMTALAYCK